MPKHFKATHRESGEVVEFNLGDIWSRLNDSNEQEIHIGAIFAHNTEQWSLEYWLEDYHLQYLHNGEYHDYEEGSND